MKPLYAGIDLHSNNNYIALIDSEDKLVFEKKKCQNNLELVLLHLSPYQSAIRGIAIESTFNWYWLVDGLQEFGYEVLLANPSAMEPYKGLKYTNDSHDARWLAHMLRLGILPTGYIYPKESRPVRDLLRKRSQLVRQKTTHLMSIQNLYARNTGQTPKSNELKRLSLEMIEASVPHPDLALAIDSNRVIMESLDTQIKLLEKTIVSRVKLEPNFEKLQTVNGVGKILSLTIMLETGEIQRFPTVGDYVSYCRCVSSSKWSNGKQKGKGNAKNGNKYLNWAFVEAANYAIRFNEQAQRFYQRKKAKTNSILATKALAHKLARASYYIMRDQVDFDSAKLFSG